MHDAPPRATVRSHGKGQDMQASETNVGGAAARWLARLAPLHFLDDYPANLQQREAWAELCRWGAVAIGVPCLTSGIAALILAWVERI